jgi:hypothetical protein
LIACALTLVAFALVFVTVDPSDSAFAAEAERADQQQRLRSAIESVSRDLRAAGRAASTGVLSGRAFDFWAPILPLRSGRRSPDPPGAFHPDVITIITASRGAAETTLAAALPAASAVALVNIDSGCSPSSTACGFHVDDDVVVYDGTGAYDMYTVADVQPAQLTLEHNTPDGAYVYPAGSKIAAATSRTLYLESDAASGSYRLMRYEGGDGPDVPLTDHVVELRFELLGDPSPPSLVRTIAEASGPWTDYGPAPPDRSPQPAGYPPGENCLFTHDAGGLIAPRLQMLTAIRDGLTVLDAALLTDGPWCPDGAHANRFDADLLRLRAVAVTLRVESASPAMRGPAGMLFTRAGTSRGGRRFVPDEQTTFVVSPSNLEPRR